MLWAPSTEHRAAFQIIPTILFYRVVWAVVHFAQFCALVFQCVRQINVVDGRAWICAGCWRRGSSWCWSLCCCSCWCGAARWPDQAQGRARGRRCHTSSPCTRWTPASGRAVSATNRPSRGGGLVTLLTLLTLLTRGCPACTAAAPGPSCWPSPRTCPGVRGQCARCKYLTTYCVHRRRKKPDTS